MLWLVVSCLACLFAGLVLLGVCWRRSHRRWVRILEFGFGLPLVVVGLLPAIWVGFSMSGDPSPRSLQLSPRISYERFVSNDQSGGAVVHWSTIDLARDPGEACLDVVLSEPGRDGLIEAEIGTGFVAATSATVAINVAFFYPIREYPHWSSYPAVGDEITAIGHVVSEGKLLGRPSDWGQYLMIDPVAGQAAIGPLPDTPPSNMWAVPGRERIVADGLVVAAGGGDRYPRTVVGVDHDAGLAHLTVVDGKQWGYSMGLTLLDVASLMVERGVDDALELDGGGSSTMAGTVDGEPALLNRPSHTRIPGRQRPVATFLGLVDRCE